MRPTEKIEKFLQKASVSSNPNVNKTVLDELTDEMEKSKQAGTSLNMWSKFMKSPITKFAAAAVIIIAVIIGISRFGNPFESKVYARMVEQLNKARTLTYSVLTKTNVESMPTVRTTWAYKDPGYLRTTTADGFVVIFNKTEGKWKGISIMPDKMYLELEISNSTGYPSDDPFDNIEKLRSLPDKTDEELGIQEIDGVEALGFRVYKDNVTTTVWIAKNSGRLVRVEMNYVNNPVMNTVMSDFQFNAELDDSLFSLTPPEGYHKIPVQVQADMAKATEQDLIAFLQTWAKYWSKDGTFPPRISGPEFAKVIYAMAKEGKLIDGREADEGRMKNIELMYRGGMFVGMLPAESNWRYMGENVKYGDAAKAIFWYKPKGSQTWRVIYGDLSVKDVNEADLPK
jgi:outer membrane lipoprotein-sorting protein